MVTIKCPHCSTALKLAQAPASGKVKCPKCSNVLAVKAPSAAAPAGPTPAQPSRPTSPAARPKQPRRPMSPDDVGFDFGSVHAPSAAPAAAVSHFPTAGVPLTVYDGPIPGDPLEAAAAEKAAAEQSSGSGPRGGKAPAKKKTSPMLVVGVLLGVGVLVVGGIVGAVMLSGGSGEPKEDLLVKLKTTAPDGYQAVGHLGAVALLPKGTEGYELPSIIGDSCTVVESSASGSIFFFGVMDGGSRSIDEEQMRKKAGRQLGGEFMGGTVTQRNGYNGIRGKLDGSHFLPNMMVEAYLVKGQFIILGCKPASMDSDPSVQMAIDRNLEQEEQDVFYKSFKVGDKPSGWLF